MRPSDLGPVLGSYHPCVLDNVRRLQRDLRPRRGVVPHVRHRGRHAGRAPRALSHPAGTHLVRFCGAYHGWWEDVQPGVGNPIPPRETYTLKTTWTSAACSVLRTAAATSPACWSTRCRRCTRMRTAPGDSIAAHRTAYATGHGCRPRGLHRLAATRCVEVCTARGIVLIFDEVFVGFRLAPGGAQAVLRRAGGHGHLRQDTRRRLAGRRGLRTCTP